MSKLLFSLAVAVSASTIAQAADLPATLATPAPVATVPLYDPTKYQIRGGFLASPFGPERGSADGTVALVFPKFVILPGWEDLLVPRLRIGGVANFDGKTSYAYIDGLWTVNFNRAFAEVFFGGLVHNGPLENPVNVTANALGCRELYHLGAGVGYRFDQHWSVTATFEHGSNGEPLLSNCPVNRGLNVTGLALGYAF